MKKRISLITAIFMTVTLASAGIVHGNGIGEWNVIPIDNTLQLPSGVKAAGIYHLTGSAEETPPSWNLYSDDAIAKMACPVYLTSGYFSDTAETLMQGIDNKVSELNQDPKRIFLTGSGAGADKVLSLVTQDTKNRYAGIILYNPVVTSKTISYAKVAKLPVYLVAMDTPSIKKICDALYANSCKLTAVLTNNRNEYNNKIYDDATLSWVLRTPTVFPNIKEYGNPLTDQGEVTIGDRALKYFLHLPRIEGLTDPENVKKGTGVKWPLIMDLHGSGGDAAVDQMLSGNLPAYGYDHLRGDEDCGYFRVFPRIPTGSHSWKDQSDLVIKIIEALKEKYSIDEDRIYLTGFSMGGMGTWNVAMSAFPDYFAAIAPAAGRAENPDNFYLIRHIPTLILHGNTDYTVPYPSALLAYYKLKAMNANVTLDSESVGHDLTTEFRGEGVTAWLLRHKKSDQQTPAIVSSVDKPKAPTVRAITDRSEEVTGKTVPYSTVVVRTGKTVLKDQADDEGIFYIELTKKLKAGNKVKISAVGMYGNEGSVTTKTVLDRTPPKKPVMAKLKSSGKKITGKTEAGARVFVTKKGKVIGKATAAKSGKFTVKLKKKLPKKTVLYVYAKDKANNKSAKAKIVVV